MQEQNLHWCLALFCWCTCRNLDFCFEASQGHSQNPHKNKRVPAFLSHAMGTGLNLKYFPCNAGCVKSLQTKHSDFLLVILLLSLQSQPPGLNACEPFTVNSRSATHGSQTLHLFIIISGSGVTWAFTEGVGVASSYLSSLSPSSCLQAAVVADTGQILCACHGKHHVVWLKVPSAVKNWGRAHFREEKTSERAHIGDKVCKTCGSFSLTARGLSRLARSVSFLPGTSLMWGW